VFTIINIDIVRNFLEQYWKEIADVVIIASKVTRSALRRLANNTTVTMCASSDPGLDFSIPCTTIFRLR